MSLTVKLRLLTSAATASLFYFNRYYVLPHFIDTDCEQCYAKNVYGICRKLITITVRERYNNENSSYLSGR